MIRPRANTDVTQALTALIRCKKTGRVDVHGAKRKEKPYRFQKKAHEEQSGFNGLDDHLEEAEVQMALAARLLSDGPALEKAKQRVKRGRKRWHTGRTTPAQSDRPPYNQLL